MKRFLLVLLMAAVAVSLAGCDDYDEQPLEFINSSSYTVIVQSLSIEWTGFALAPGQRQKLTGIRDVDFAWEPDHVVEEGFASTDRYIVFVDVEREEIDWGD
ncbi:MAG: hypothetical protein EOL90_01945 [Spartobacteria bacterium]|nr:hypothetical protein [Spartobacteria bacterium]